MNGGDEDSKKENIEKKKLVDPDAIKSDEAYVSDATELSDSEKGETRAKRFNKGMKIKNSKLIEF